MPRILFVWCAFTLLPAPYSSFVYFFQPIHSHEISEEVEQKNVISSKIKKKNNVEGNPFVQLSRILLQSKITTKMKINKTTINSKDIYTLCSHVYANTANNKL